VNYNVPTTTASLGFGSVLADGNYRVTVSGAGVSDAAGNPLDGDNDGVALGNFTYDFFVLTGDANHDKTVDTADFNALAAHFAQAGNYANGDFNYDGLVDTTDFNLLAGHFGNTLPGDAAGAAGSSLSASAALPGNKTGIFSNVPVSQAGPELPSDATAVTDELPA
jgi:hypothetical protein